MPTRKVIQLAIDEQLVEDDELLSTLLERHKRRESLNAVRAEYDEMDRQAKALIERLTIDDDKAIRVGDFRITSRLIKGGSRSFETKDRRQVAIEHVDE